MVKFGKAKTKSSISIQRLLMLAVFAGVLILFLWAVSVLSGSNIENQQESLEKALNRCVSQCYALEGTYPPNLAYIKEHYGLIYNEDLFYIDYQPIGSNIPPDITVIITQH